EVADDLRSIFYAPSLKKAKELFQVFGDRWEREIPSAVKCLARSCLSEPHGGGWGGSSAKMHWASHLKASFNNTSITDLEMLSSQGKYFIFQRYIGSLTPIRIQEIEGKFNFLDFSPFF
ncbi:MAG: hypothetical protein V3V81_04850, partial [Candidatus Bathyarchaeia archaeon]